MMKNVLSCAIEAKLRKPYLYTDNKIHLAELLFHVKVIGRLYFVEPVLYILPLLSQEKLIYYVHVLYIVVRPFVPFPLLYLLGIRIICPSELAL